MLQILSFYSDDDDIFGFGSEDDDEDDDILEGNKSIQPMNKASKSSTSLDFDLNLKTQFLFKERIKKPQYIT
jgi:hypothetical protein